MIQAVAGAATTTPPAPFLNPGFNASSLTDAGGIRTCVKAPSRVRAAVPQNAKPSPTRWDTHIPPLAIIWMPGRVAMYSIRIYKMCRTSAINPAVNSDAPVLSSIGVISPGKEIPGLYGIINSSCSVAIPEVHTATGDMFIIAERLRKGKRVSTETGSFIIYAVCPRIRK